MVMGSNGNDRRNVHNPSLPLCSREGGTAVPDEIEVIECSMCSIYIVPIIVEIKLNVRTDITVGSISSVAAVPPSLTHKGSLGLSLLMLIFLFIHK